MFNKIVTAIAILACVSNAHKDDRRECQEEREDKKQHKGAPATGGVSAAFDPPPAYCQDSTVVIPWYPTNQEWNDCMAIMLPENFMEISGFWGMLPAYRSGGTHGVHWKYTNTLDSNCLKNWIYYNSDGTTCQNNDCSVISGLTTRGASQSWCALNNFRSGGVENYQWKYCSNCTCSNCGEQQPW